MADLTAKRTEAQVARAAAEAAAQAAQEQLPALAENTEALEAQRDEAKQDLPIPLSTGRCWPRTKSSWQM